MTPAHLYSPVSRLAAIVTAALLLAVSTTINAADVTTTFSSRKTGEVPRKTNETEFTCSDTIYALIETRDLAQGVHDIEIQWLDPRGDRQELTQFSTHTAGDGAMVWAWMRLHPPENSGLVRTFDPSHGMRIFIGEWTVKVYIDGDHVSTDHFDVLC